MGLFSEISAYTIFLGIAGVGFLFLLLSLIFGEIFEDFGGVDHDVDGGDTGGPGILSPRVLSVFATAFGGIGAVAVYYGLSAPAASVAGFVGGGFFGGLMYLFARFLYGQQATTEFANADLKGLQGRVVVTIPGNGVGQVRCQIGEQVVDKIARSTDGGVIESNTMAEVIESLGEALTVKRLS